ncbi:MAG: hemerythrin domain-containing protein [Phycisphaeraceae bacterium]|nr:hemerythrin domain-containing protein [Phycisphaeraceae bacterium]MCW5762895.1 hemerythrin domain-containing protein [Phycisphaeraceae bacterium]
MPVSLGQQGQPGFDSPLELMSDCHRRIESFLAVFGRVLDRYASRDLDEEGVNALRTAQRYFREGAPRHTEDEEHSLFPRLRQLERDDLGELLEAADRLERQHDEAERLHASVDARVDRWLDARRLSAADAKAMAADLETLDRLYAEHIAFEDNVLFPAAARVLDEPALRSIGEEMAARRGRNTDGTTAREAGDDTRRTQR